MRLLDRYIVRNFLLNYVLAFGVLVGMYTLLDLIINFSNFTRASAPGAGAVTQFFSLLADICDYYAYRIAGHLPADFRGHSPAGRGFHHGPHDPAS